jgi:hypothetical protein
MKLRPIYNTDIPALQAAIDADIFHPAGTWQVEHFRGFAELFEDKHGIVVFTRYEPEAQRLRIMTVWTTPENKLRNAKAIIFLVRAAGERATRAGFKELIFTTKHPPLAAFCSKALGFIGIGDDQYILKLEEAQNE